MGKRDAMVFNHVKSCIDNEGFDYCFRSYSDFEGMEDPKFQELRKAYVDAADALEKYIIENTEED
jgi:hypothetical protein